MTQQRTIGIGLLAVAVVAALLLGGFVVLSETLAEDSYTLNRRNTTAFTPWIRAVTWEKTPRSTAR